MRSIQGLTLRDLGVGSAWNPMRPLLQPRLALLTTTLAVASVVVTCMVAVRILYTGQLLYAFLAWNLALAWMPMILAAAAEARWNQKGSWDWQCIVLGIGWLLFFPNAPYIVTDLVHLSRGAPALFWADLMLVLTSALIGLALALASLRLLHARVRQSIGWWTGWGFVAGAAGLAAFGVHLGRFVRLNSWDLVFSPLLVLQEVLRTVIGMACHPHQAVFPALFAFFLFLAYAVFHAMSIMTLVQGVGSRDAETNLQPGDRP